MSYVEEVLNRERIAELHRAAERTRRARALRAQRRAEVAERRVDEPVDRSGSDAVPASAVGTGARAFT